MLAVLLENNELCASNDQRCITPEPMAEIAPPLVEAWQLVTLTAVSSRWLVEVSLHTLTMLSPEPLTMWLPSGEYATEWT